MAGSIELAATFDRAAGERLLAAERLVLSLPQLFRGLLLECDLAYRSSSRFFAVVARLATKGYGAEARERFLFWAARAGGLGASLSALPPLELSAFAAQLEQCDQQAKGVSPQVLFDAIGRIVTEAGAPPDRKVLDYPRPTLSMDMGGPGWEGVSYDRSVHGLFIPGAIAPPVGDEITVAVRVPRRERPLEARAKVWQVRPPEKAEPGAPAGFTLVLLSPPPELEQALGQWAQAPEVRRAAPRYPVKAPVKVTARPAAPSGTAPPASPKEPAAAAPSRPPPASATARIEYRTEQELALDYVENLSQGGAFVRTAAPPPVGSRLTLEMKLPGGVALEAPATVVYAHPYGMGVKFELDSANESKLAAVIARISARPRRALVVDDDGLTRRLFAEALASRGFEVLTAQDGREGLHVLAEELLALDLLVTDLRMPGMDGETLVRTIREQGGETELAVVVVSGALDAAAEERLARAGADAVLDKSLGPEMVAQAADAALERKRLAAGH